MAQPARYRGARDLLLQIHTDLGRLLSPPETRQDLKWPEFSMSDWMPSIDVKEEVKQYIIHVDLPGVRSDDIEIKMENGLLTIRGNRETETKKERENYLRIERSNGSFSRQFTLPATVDQKHIEAKYHEGVLEIILPKSPKNSGHKIKIKKD